MITIKTDSGLHVFRFHINIRFLRPRPTWVGYTAFTDRLCFAPRRALRNNPTETSSELRRTETSQNCNIELQNITLCCSGYRAHPLLFRLVGTTNHGIDRGQADDAPYNPALRYGFSLLIGLVIIYGDVGLLSRYQKVNSTPLVLRAGRGSLVGRPFSSCSLRQKDAILVLADQKRQI
jgi:hypothetical protein